MQTICINPDCQQVYSNIKPEQIGKIARCKRCDTVFTVEEYIEQGDDLPFDLVDADDSEQESDSAEEKAGGKKKRSSQEIIQQKIKDIKIAAKRTIPLIIQLYEKGANETETRHGIEVILRDLLGYDLVADLRKEFAVRGLKADYIVDVKGKPAFVVEAKRIGVNLNQNHIYQATNYGTLTGIQWVVLTNGLVWQLYRVLHEGPYEYYRVFTIDLIDGLSDDEAKWFYLISKDCMCRKNFLESQWQKTLALSPQNLLSTILSDEVISKIRSTITRETGYRATDGEVREAIEQKVMVLE